MRFEPGSCFDSACDPFKDKGEVKARDPQEYGARLYTLSDIWESRLSYAGTMHAAGAPG